jgi:hypothetical protein
MTVATRLVMTVTFALMVGGCGRQTASPAPAGSGQPAGLTAQDYADIQQLAASYAFAIDTCTNSGYDYADLYVDDGQFSVSEAWGDVGGVLAKGREALAVAAGGGKDGCQDPRTQLGYGIHHIAVNHEIKPTPDGARGRSYLLAIGVGGQPTTIEYQGGYEDVYVRTPAGWRFKSRVHVFPNIKTSVQFGPGGLPAPPTH